MTLQELNKLRDYPLQIEELKDKIFHLQRRAESATHVISGMPSARGKNDYLENTIISCVDEQKKLRRLIYKLQREQARAMKYISQLDNSDLRAIFILRFIKGYTYKQIADQIGGVTADAVRIRIIRYFKKDNNG